MMQQKYLHIFTILQKEIETPDSTDWVTWKYLRQDVEKMLNYGLTHELHEQMQRFYRCYLWKDLESYRGWAFMDFVAERDVCFGRWATENIDLTELTERWIELGNSVW